MFNLRRQYLTPKGRLGAKSLADSAQLKITASMYDGVAIEIEATDGSVYKLVTGIIGARKLSAALNSAADEVTTGSLASATSIQVPA
jgi:hypothetical protein